MSIRDNNNALHGSDGRFAVDPLAHQVPEGLLDATDTTGVDWGSVAADPWATADELDDAALQSDDVDVILTVLRHPNTAIDTIQSVHDKSETDFAAIRAGIEAAGVEPETPEWNYEVCPSERTMLAAKRELATRSTSTV